MSLFIVFSQSSACGLPVYQLTANLFNEPTCPLEPFCDGGASFSCSEKKPYELLQEIKTTFDGSTYFLSTTYSDSECKKVKSFKAEKYDGECYNIGASSFTKRIKAGKLVNDVYFKVGCQGKAFPNYQQLPERGCIPNKDPFGDPFIRNRVIYKARSLPPVLANGLAPVASPIAKVAIAPVEIVEEKKEPSLTQDLTKRAVTSGGFVFQAGLIAIGSFLLLTI